MTEKSGFEGNGKNTENKTAVLDASEASSHCGRGVKLSGNGEFLSMNLGEYDRETKKAAESAEKAADVFEAFLDEPVDAEIPEALEIDPQLAAEWEKKLAESFKNDPIAPDDDEPPFHAVRKRRPRKK